MPARKKARVVTETLSTSARQVGPLSIFGLRDAEFWRVPTLLPKRYLDVRRPITRFSELIIGQWVCLGGRPSNARIVSRGLQCPAIVEEVGVDATDCTESTSASGSDDDPDAGDTARPDDQSILSAPGRDDIWQFDLTDLYNAGRICVEIIASTRTDIALLERVHAGEAIWLHGHVCQSEPGVILRDAQGVPSSDLGEVLAFYPSKSSRHTVRERSKRTNRLVERTYLRKISSATTAVLIREKNRLAISRCAQVLRDRMRLTCATDEWELLQLLGSPAPTIEATLKVAHTPPDLESGVAASRALERLCAVELLQHIRREKDAGLRKPKPIPLSNKAFAAAIDDLSKHGIVPTQEQRLVAMEILADLATEYRTHRLLSGDVGTGKTVVFAIVAACVHSAGQLVVVLEPRSQLAEQVFRKLSTYFPHIPTQLLTSASNGEAIKKGIVVGTTGVWSRLAAAGCTPGLIVSDEQQKLGVGQRRPPLFDESNLLEATATAIPRTQGLIEFGGVDVSMLKHTHVRKSIETKVVIGNAGLLDAYHTVARRIEEEGKNLILVFPRIGSADDVGACEDDEEAAPVALLDAVHDWELQFPGRVACVHGRMEDQDRADVLRRFEAGALSILISSSIIEVGIDFRQADMMIVHYPERLGVAAVHQLRGRLVRQGGVGWCFLAPSPGASKEQVALLTLMESENDGFALALADMQRRGVGDLRRHARQQSGDYEGFLVQRPPLVDDLEWSMDHCQRWIGSPGVSCDLLQDSVAMLDSMSRMAKAPRPKQPPSLGVEPHIGLQQPLF